MRALLSIILLLGMPATFLLADIQPTASTALGASSTFLDSPVATTPIIVGTETLIMRGVAMALGIILLIIAGYLAFGRKQRQLPAPPQEK
jgi:hypothetical protein